jgi:hypothetical protein
VQRQWNDGNVILAQGTERLTAREGVEEHCPMGSSLRHQPSHEVIGLRVRPVCSSKSNIGTEVFISSGTSSGRANCAMTRRLPRLRASCCISSESASPTTTKASPGGRISCASTDGPNAPLTGPRRTPPATRRPERSTAEPPQRYPCPPRPVAPHGSFSTSAVRYTRSSPAVRVGSTSP